MDGLLAQVVARCASVVLVCVVLMATFACTSIVDLEEDCVERNSCEAFRCSEDNVACKSNCSVDSDCSLGATCQSASCEYSECLPNLSRYLIGSFEDDIESAGILNLSEIGVYVAIVEAGDGLYEIAMKVEGGRIVDQVTSVISDGPSADFVFGVVPFGERGAIALWSRARTDVGSLKIRRYSFSADGDPNVVFDDVPFGNEEELVITGVSLEAVGDDALLVVNTSGTRPEVFASKIRGDSIQPLLRQHADGFSARTGSAHRVDGELLLAFLESDSTEWRARVRSAESEPEVDYVFAQAPLPGPLNFGTYGAFDKIFRAAFANGEPITLQDVYPPNGQDEVRLSSGVSAIAGVSVDDNVSSLGSLILGEFGNGAGLYFRYIRELAAPDVDYTRVVEATASAEIGNYSMDEQGDDVAVLWAEESNDLNRSRLFVSSFSCQAR